MAVRDFLGRIIDTESIHDTDPERETFLPARLSPEALRAAFGPRAATVIPLGDSLTGNGSTSYDATSQGLGNPLIGYSVRGYWSWASVLLGHRLKLIRNAGIATQTAEQILARVDTDVVAHSPGWCIVEAGRNSVSAGVSATTLIGTLTSLYDKLLGAGIRVVATTITPRDTDTNADLAILFAVNSWMKEYVRSRPGMVLADVHAAVADPTTGDWKTGYSYDGLHPGALGARKMGQVIADALDPFVPKADLLATSNADPTNLLLNGLLTGTGGTLGTGVTGSVAASWRVDGTSTITATASKVARTDGKPGDWQQIAVSAVAANNMMRFRQTVALGGDVAIGNTFVAMCEFETDADFTPGAKFDFGFYAMNGSSVGVASTWDLSATTDVHTAEGRVVRGVMRTPPLAIPAGTVAGLNVMLRSDALGTLRVGRVTLRKV